MQSTLEQKPFLPQPRDTDIKSENRRGRLLDGLTVPSLMSIYEEVAHFLKRYETVVQAGNLTKVNEMTNEAHLTTLVFAPSCLPHEATMVSKIYFVVCDDVAARPAFLPYKHSRTPHFQLRSSPKQLEALWRRRTLRQDKRLQRFARKSNLFRNASRMLPHNTPSASPYDQVRLTPNPKYTKRRA